MLSPPSLPWGCGRSLGEEEHLLSPEGQGAKVFRAGNVSISSGATRERALRLNFSWQLGRFLGVRLNTYSDSIERAGVRCPCSSHLNPLSRAAIRRRGPVQKLSFSSPTRCPFNAMAAARGFPAELRAPVFCGCASGADAPNLLFSAFVPEGCRPRARTSRGRQRASKLAPPAVERSRVSAAGRRSQSMRRSPAAPNADRGCSGTNELGRRLVRASGGSSAPVRLPGGRRPGPKFNFGSARR